MSLIPVSHLADQTLLQFARAHLTTPAYRAVYTVLGGADDWWRPAEVAAASRISVHEIDVALRQLAAAGVVEARTPGDDPRYRWCLDLRSLSEPHTDDEFEIDPMCGMPVPATSPFVLEDTSGLHRFCSLRCMTAARRARRGASANTRRNDEL